MSNAGEKGISKMVYAICMPCSDIQKSNVYFFDGNYYEIIVIHPNLEILQPLVKGRQKIAFVDWTESKNPIFIKWIKL